MFQKAIRNNPRISSRIDRLRLLAGVLAAGLSVPALAQSVPFPTYTVGPQTNGTFVVSDGTILTPSGKQVNLGIRVRAKAIALNPTGNHTAAVLTMGTAVSNGNGAVEVFNTQSGKVLQSYSFGAKDSTGSNTGITYTPDGKYLLFSQDGNLYGSYVAIASVNATTGMLSDYAHVSVPMDVNSNFNLTNVTCFPNSPGGTTGSFLIPCGQTVSVISNRSPTSYPTGIAVSSDAKTAYVVLDNNDTLTKIDLTTVNTGRGRGDPRRQRPAQRRDLAGWQDRLRLQRGRPDCYRRATSRNTPTAPRSSPNIRPAPRPPAPFPWSTWPRLKSPAASRPACTRPAWPSGATDLLVANTYDDTISVIDTTTNKVVRTINLGLPIGVPGQKAAGLRRRTELDRRRCQEQHRLRRAVQRQRHRRGRPHTTAWRIPSRA